MIGEDESGPGAELEEEFKQIIQDCSIFIALFSEPAARSRWVIIETNYARSINNQ
jgi:TIR domain